MQGSFYLLTLGCQMNKNDSERIAGLLLSAGLVETARPEEADILIINTCSVRQTAEDRVYGLVDGWQKYREKNPDLIITVTGCMPGRDKDGKLRAKLPGVDLFFGIEELPLLPKRIGKFLCRCERSPEPRFPGSGQSEAIPTLLETNCLALPNNGIAAPLPTVAPRDDKMEYFSVTPSREIKYKAHITIQIGCDNFCSYCVVPYARGREKNRPMKDVLDEIKSAAAAGAKEVTLLGQVVNNYQAPDAENFSKDNPFALPLLAKEGNGGRLTADDFAALLWEANQIAGVERLHWTAADPQYFSAAQIEALALPKQVNYLHLPAQSGDNEVLKKMNRHYTREHYVDLIKKIRARRPDIAIGTDLIVGFPGETEEQFQNTVDLYQQCDFDIAYLAMYSERSGTAAVRAFKDDIPRAEKKRRWRVLQNLMEETTLRKNQKYLGRTVSVLVEQFSPPFRGGAQRGCFGICAGNSYEMKLTRFAGGADLVGKIVNVKIIKPEVWVLEGVIDR